MAFGLYLVAQEQGPAVGPAGHAVETFAEEEVAVLGAGDFDIPIAGEVRLHQSDGVFVGVESFIEAVGKEAGLEAGGAEECLLGEGDALGPRVPRRVPGS